MYITEKQINRLCQFKDCNIKSENIKNEKLKNSSCTGKKKNCFQTKI